MDKCYAMIGSAKIMQIDSNHSNTAMTRSYL